MTEQCIGKRELNKQRKRAAIVEAARDSFLHQGYAATSMTAVAEKLSCSKATMWSHFGSKEELFCAVLDELVGNFSDEVSDVLDSRIFSISALHRAGLRFLDCLLAEPSVQLFRLVLSEGERFPEVAEMFYDRAPAKFRRRVCAFFATHFEVEDAERLTRVVVAAILGFRSDILLRPVRPDRSEMTAFVDDLIASIAWPPELALADVTGDGA